jgi:hypothetical protein
LLDVKPIVDLFLSFVEFFHGSIENFIIQLTTMLTNRLRKIGLDFAVLFSAVPQRDMSVKEVQESIFFL